MSDYIPPAGNVITLDFKGDLYTPPLGNVVALDFSTQAGPVGETQYLFPTAIASQSIGSPSVRNSREYVSPQGINAAEYGKPALRNNTIIVNPRGWQSSAVGRPPSVVSYFKDIYPPSIDSSLYGRPLVYNLTQYRTMRGFDASEYGKPYLMGGVKYLTSNGINSNAFGSAVLTNTTANQTARPVGINSLVIPSPNVSPRIIYPQGILSLSMGVPNIYDPSVKPLGLQHTSYGSPTVWFHTRPLAPNGILSYESGYLRIADPTQFVQTPSLIESAIFGDIAIRNLSFRINVSAIYDGAFSDYATLTNTSRYYTPNGINSLAIGSASIANVTPQLFPIGITANDTGSPAIGYAIRYVQPTGFDHLLLGRAVLTKAPELKPQGHQSSVIGQQWISYKNRAIDLTQKGVNSFKAGETTVWYGVRSFKPNNWQSSSYGIPTLTHEVREVIAQGFKRDAYGTAWVSFGTRRLEPASIYKEFASSHMVGGTQTVSPVGYIATLWGERIIPDGQNLYPLGFIGDFGDSAIDLQTKYVAPVGFISVGQQPADRWGDAKAYNSVQHIIQEYDVNSGLVPPKWSDWMLIANRNIQMNVTGFANQRFGYSQIDNNATPLLPNGIAPPQITIGMISHGIRTVSPEAIEAPPLSTWVVVNNGARVIAPTSHAHTQMGDNGTVINTRREYRNVGRIESLETGIPMIAYRIRTIDIESRYSIAPPQINLPTVDLYTRYIGFNGYETVKYGLPSLSVYFRIIKPSWAHRDDFGESGVRNLTPELQVGAFDSQDFGRASIRTQSREVIAQGDTATLFGLAMIADTKRVIQVRGWQGGSSSQLHTVTKTATPPYGTQNIWLQNESNPSEDGYGIFDGKVGIAGINQNVLYQHGHDSQKFGEAIVSSNNLYIDYGISIKNFGTGTLVRTKNRYINVTGIDNTIKTGDKLMVTPFYIKPDGFNQPYDTSVDNDKFGRTIFTNQHRTIYPRGHQSSSVGNSASAELHTRYLVPSPIRSFAMGFPEIPFTTKVIDIKNNGFDSASIGQADLSRPPYTGPQTISHKGFYSFNASSQRVELLHRKILATGNSHLRMGVSTSDDTPYMWQSLRIGAFVPMSIGAGDTSIFGATTIGLRVRDIALQGFIAFRSEYEPSKFKERIKVTGTITDNIQSQHIGATGFSSSGIGWQGVKYGQQFIRPDGNSDQFRKSSYAADFGAPTISS